MKQIAGKLRRLTVQPMRVATVFLVIFGAPLAVAQTASEVTPQTFQPPLQRLTGAVSFTGQASTQAPPGSEQIGITLSGVTLEDGLSAMATANAAFVARLTRGRIAVSEMFDATADLEAAYAQAGFVLARVVLPQQRLEDGGQLRVTVVNGFVEDIDTTAVAENTLRRVQQLTEGLVGKPGITQAELERQLLLAGDVPGVALRSALAAGEQEGGTVIALDPEYRLVTGFVGIGNPSGPELGGYSLNTGIEFNSPLRFGETFYARASGSVEEVFSDDPRSRIIAIGAVAPLGYSGLTANVEYTMSDTTPTDVEVPTRSNFDRASVRLAYPLIRSRDMNVNLTAALDIQEDTQALADGGAEVYEDRLSVLRLGGSVSKIYDSGTVSEAGAVLSQGFDAFDARSAADASDSAVPLSRDGADVDFSKLTASFSHQRALTDTFALSVTGRFQTSFGDALPVSEQFSLVGPRELSAFDGGDLRGDSGWVIRSEVSTQQRMELSGVPLVVSPYAFVGVGGATLANPTDVENTNLSASVFGVGADLFTISESSFRSTTVRIELGRGERDDGRSDENRFSISGNWRF